MEILSGEIKMINRIKQMFNKVNGDIVAGDKIQFNNSKSRDYYKEIIDILNKNLDKRIEHHIEVRKSILDSYYADTVWWADNVVDFIIPRMHEIGLIYENEITPFITELKEFSPNLFKKYSDAFKFEQQTRENMGRLIIIPSEYLQKQYGVSNFIEMYSDIIEHIKEEKMKLINEEASLFW